MGRASRSGCSAPNYSVRGHVPSSSNTAPPASASSATPPRLPQIAFLRRGADPAEANRASIVIGPSASRPRSTFGVAPPRRTYCGSLVVFAESRLQISPIRRIKDLGHFDIYQTFVTYQWQDWRSRQHAGKVVWCTGMRAFYIGPTTKIGRKISALLCKLRRRDDCRRTFRALPGAPTYR